MHSFSRFREPIFVCGYMHSGTTLLRNILRNSSEVFCGQGETKFFEFLPIIRREYPDLRHESTLREFIEDVVGIVRFGYRYVGDENRRQESDGLTAEHLNAILTQAEKQRNHEMIFRIVSDYLTGISGKARWLEKTPTHVFYIEKILQHIPNAKFVVVVRDPRDVLASKKTRKTKVWTTDRYSKDQRLFKHLRIYYDPLWDGLSWKAAIRAGEIGVRRYPENVYQIRYEDLVPEPEMEVRRMCSFLNMTFQYNLLNVDQTNPADWKNGAQKKKGFVEDSVGRWHSVLCKPEVALVQYTLKNEMRRLDYLRTELSFSGVCKMPLLALNSILDFIRRVYRRMQIGGFELTTTTISNYCKRARNIKPKTRAWRKLL